ncbi:hypothetical protein [Streptomyces wuyuanensis]
MTVGFLLAQVFAHGLLWDADNKFYVITRGEQSFTGDTLPEHCPDCR